MRTPFAQLLRRERLARGLTQQELADRARLSERSISDLERVVKTAPRLVTVRLLIEALGLEGADAVALREAVQRARLKSSARQLRISMPRPSTSHTSPVSKTSRQVSTPG